MNEVKEKIKAYLDKRAAEDELFAKSYAKEKKSIDECLMFIMGEARKQAVKMAGGSSAMIDDATVFGWAVHYYDEDDIKVAPVNGTASAGASNRQEKREHKNKQQVKPEVSNQQLTFNFD